jgi:hypothetical protein
MALHWSQLYILPARQSYILQYGKMASGPEKAFSVLAVLHRTSKMKLGLISMNVFVIVGSGVEALWNGF